MNTIIKDGQSLFDIAVQAAGSVEAVFGLKIVTGTDEASGMELLEECSITGELAANTQLQVPDILNRDIANYYSINTLVPATGYDDAIFFAEGVEFWRIGYDFAVS